MHPVSFNAVAMVYAAGIMGVVAVITERDRPVAFDFGPVAAMVYMAVAGTAITFPLYFWLLEHMEARQVALIGYGTPVVALLLGVFMMNEPITAHILIGSAMVVVGVAVASHTRKGKE